MANKKTLGRGLHSLIPEVNDKKDELSKNQASFTYQNNYSEQIKPAIDKSDISTEKTNKREEYDLIKKIPLDKIVAREGQPRKSFDQEAINDLAASIKEYGLLNPIVVSKEKDKYEIIAGERRFRASKKAGLKQIDAIVREYHKKDVEILSLVENVQREDLKILEEASAYKKLSDDYKMTQEQIAKTMGKSRSYIANTLRLLNLKDEEKQALNDGKISPSQARTLLSISDIDQRKNTLNEFKEGTTNIRKVEKKSSKKKDSNKEPIEKKAYAPNIDDILVEDLEEKFMDQLGSKVAINKTGKTYKVSIDCFSIEDIESLYKRIKNETNWNGPRYSY